MVSTIRISLHESPRDVRQPFPSRCVKFQTEKKRARHQAFLNRIARRAFVHSREVLRRIVGVGKRLPKNLPSVLDPLQTFRVAQDLIFLKKCWC